MHIAESDSAMYITLPSQTTSKMFVFVFSNLLRLSTTFYQKIFLKQFSYHFLSQQRNNNHKILIQNRCLASYWLRSGLHTMEFFQKLCYHDSRLWCTPQSLTWRYDAHREVLLCGKMHNVKSDSLTLRWDAHHGTFKISSKLKLNSKIVLPVCQGPRWVWITKKMEVKNLVAHSL